MKIKKLQIYGFKTFVAPTEIIFHDGVTSVVGPNGCGKSNIIDALRWVMGEKSAKGLRGDSMEDVIFSGCASRKALNFAEVTLTLSEVEGKLPEKFGAYHEISVTRRLHRAGDSEYLINKVHCRLKDITDLFLDTGLGKRAYSIVEQGRIDAILSAKPVDRRFLIEEAAGLSKYRARRDETLAKMKQTGENLERLNDIITEVKREMTALKRQAGRAKAFKELRAEKRLIDRDLLVSAWLDLEARLAEARSAQESVREELAGARAGADRLGIELETHRVELLEEEKQIEEAQRKVYSFRHQVSERENRAVFLKREGQGFLERSVRAEAEGAELSARAESILAELDEFKAEIEALTEELELHKAAAVELESSNQSAVEERRRAEAGLERHRAASFTTVSEMSRVKNALEHTSRQEKEAQRKIEQLDRQEEEISRKLEEVASESDSRKSELSTAEKALGQAVEERERLTEDAEDLSFERQTLTRRAEELRKSLNEASAKLKGLLELKNGLESYGQGVKAILRHARDQKWLGVRGVVADTVSVPQMYEAALEAALGERLQYVVVADTEQALESVSVLKSKAAGRSSFVPADLREPGAWSMPKVSEPWAHGPLLNLVRVQQGGERVAGALLGGIFVVDTLAHAVELKARGGSDVSYVTLEGDLLTAEGVVTGGAQKGADSGILRRNREIGELHALAGELGAKLSSCEDDLAEVSARHDEAKRRLDYMREEAHRQELRVAHVSRDMEQFGERLESLNERREGIVFERDEVSEELDRLGTQLKKLEGERVTLIRESEAQEEKRLALEEAVRKAAQAVEGISGELNRLRVTVASERQRREGLIQQTRSLERTREATGERAKRLATEAVELMKEHKAKLTENERIALELEILNRELNLASSSMDENLRKLDERRAEVGKKDKDAGAARRAADEIQTRLTQKEIYLRETEIEIRTLAERFTERLPGSIEEEAATGVSEGFDREESRARLAELEDKIRSFGEVNLLADEEYEERRVRFEFLETQRIDLEESLSALKSAIQRINRISRERFETTFHAVNEKFTALFPSLFRGGEASLFLTDPENLLETGIDIIARPPGKRPQHMSLLSGGEKALTAVALIFSLFLVKPSPFCVLDEVDAPLDDANVERFTELLGEMAGASQFLVITHNKITMEAAAHLYGVTMEEPGISNLVSVRLKEAFQAVEVA